ncbi:MAG: S1-like domain-containing RNA-binding protein [Bacteroidota bacterium]
MQIIGKQVELEVTKKVDFGYYLDGGPYGEILLPNREVKTAAEAGQEMEVFIYCDSEDRLVATQRQPRARVGECAYLEVVSVNEYGAFLDWGLLKDLFVPFREQQDRMQEGQSYLVRVDLDEATDRIFASSRLKRYLKSQNETLEEGQEVQILIAQQTDLGYKVIVEHTYWGMLYRNEIFQPLRRGEAQRAYIKRVREDGLLDISLQKQGAEQIPEDAAQVLAELRAHDGFLPLNDKSQPEQIYNQLEMSKKAFKKAIGNLYKQRLITIQPEGIRLV